MRRKHKSRGRQDKALGESIGSSSASVFASPFKELKKLLRGRLAKPASAPASVMRAPEPGPKPEPDDTALFLKAVDGTRPLGDRERERLSVEPEVRRDVVSEEAEVLAQLSDLVSGQGPFELTETDEYIEGARVGVDPRLVTRLRRGEFAVQAHIDLHGMVQGEAREKLVEFVLESVRKGLRTVLVVHGRGRRSPGGQAVLKQAAARWLSRGRLGAWVLAFTTARPCDGGAGATCVLLRRERRRAPFDVLRGTKRRD